MWNMANRLKQDILPLVKQPSRYLGCEVNRTRKDLHGAKLRVALAFPDMYEIGTSHFGMQILYDQLNGFEDIAAERVFTPDIDMQKQLRDNNLGLFSLESQWPLKRFDIIGFSLLYELNYTNILAMLDLAGIPFYSADRSDEYPVVIAGGPCTANPEPVADFFDAMRSRRVYKAPQPDAVIIDILKKESGTTFNPQLVDHFLRLIEAT